MGCDHSRRMKNISLDTGGRHKQNTYTCSTLSHTRASYLFIATYRMLGAEVPPHDADLAAGVMRGCAPLFNAALDADGGTNAAALLQASAAKKASLRVILSQPRPLLCVPACRCSVFWTGKTTHSWEKTPGGGGGGGANDFMGSGRDFRPFLRKLGSWEQQPQAQEKSSHARLKKGHELG